MKSVFKPFVVLLVAACVLPLLAACSSSGKVGKSRPIKDYEKTFDPSQYRDKPEGTQAASKPQRVSNTRNEVSREPAHGTPRLPDSDDPPSEITFYRTVREAGFRVQILSTTNLDEAERRSDVFKAEHDSVAVAIVFDAPYYKVRAGNFTQKPDADTLCTSLRELGLNDAWVVRDMIERQVEEQVKANDE